MGKQDRNGRTVILVIGRYRVIKCEENIYRLQYRKPFSIFDFVKRKPIWKTISINFYHLNRVKVALYNYANKKRL